MQTQIKSIVSKYTSPNNIKILEDVDNDQFTAHNTSNTGHAAFSQNNPAGYGATQNRDVDTNLQMENPREYSNIDELIANIYKKV